MKTERSFYLGVIAVLAVIIFFQRACNRPQECKKQHCEEMESVKIEPISDTTSKIISEEVGWHKPKEVSRPAISKRSESGQKAPISSADEYFISSQPESGSNELQLADKCNELHFYSDTNQIEAGKVIVESVVQDNELKAQKVKTDLKQVTIEKTIVKTVKEEPRGHFYFGIVGQGQRANLLNAFGGSVIWRSKREKVFQASVLIDQTGSKAYQLGTFFKLF